MSRPIISIQNLSKQYFIGENLQGLGARTFRDMFDYRVKKLLRRDGSGKAATNDLWALSGVSFDIDEGEVVGIIGRNGAGKSTLLKILSRITEPTRGKVTLRGRVASLLEVGTGFNLELTGRENIFLNGAILGMRRAEITRKFDEIVAFAEVERFIDTPVKRYSSGMYLRLAFAVAAHLEPEVLLIDEVLAVGDVEFQKKCLGKMNDIARKTDRTILFVSHNMEAIRTICTRAVLLSAGKLLDTGNPNEIIRRYITKERTSRDSVINLENADRQKGNGVVKITQMAISDVQNQATTEFRIYEPIKLTLTARCRNAEGNKTAFWVLIKDDEERYVLSSFEYDSFEGKMAYREQSGEEATVTVLLDPSVLPPGSYKIEAGIFGPNREFYDWVSNAGVFSVSGSFTDGRLFDQRLGIVTVPCKWSRT
jgi:lipopolysaccharide transport system ATP-binding protein